MRFSPLGVGSEGFIELMPQKPLPATAQPAASLPREEIIKRKIQFKPSLDQAIPYSIFLNAGISGYPANI